MPDELKEVQERYSCMFNKTRQGDYQEIDRADLYNALHVLAKRLRELELTVAAMREQENARLERLQVVEELNAVWPRR